MPSKFRLALTAIAATAVTAAVAPASFADTAVPHQAVQPVSGTPAPLSFSPDVYPAGVGGPDSYLIAFAGPGCDMQAKTCTDPAVPAGAGTTYSLDVQDLAGTVPVTNLGTGTGSSVGTNSAQYYAFPSVPAGSSGTWKVTITFTNGTSTWASSTLIDYGSATAAPISPTTSISPEMPAAGQPATFTAKSYPVAAGSPKWQVIVDYGDGSPQETHDVNPATAAAAFAHTYPYNPAKSGYTAWVATFDGVHQSAWEQLDVQVSPVHAVLSATPASGSASTLLPLTVTLDASASTSAVPGATITGYSFQCGASGVTAQPVPGQPGKATCTFIGAGTYPVSVIVTDSKGNHNTSAPLSVAVGQAAAYSQPSFGLVDVGQVASAPLTAYADLSHITVDPHADPAKVAYTVDWGDGAHSTLTKAQVPAGGRITHPYAAAGPYNVMLTVNDGLGTPQSQQSTTVRITIATRPTGPAPVERAAGADRFDTGVLVSRKRWADAGDHGAPASAHPAAVVLATGAGFADALAGVPFSVKVNGSLLLTAPTALTPEVKAEIQRILPADASHTVYVLGGTAAVSPGVVSTLTGLGYHVTRISGDDRYATALQIAHAMGDPAHAVVARGDDFADALSAGPLAADLFGTKSGAGYLPAAIVLSNGKTLDAGTKAYLHGRFTAGSGQTVIAVGGGAAQALTTVPGFQGTGADRNSGQLSGNDRYETAAKVADVFEAVDPGAPIGVATGLAYPDALTGGGFMASIGGPLLLTDPKAASGPMASAVRERADTTSGVFVFGGENAIAPGVFAAIVADVRGVAAKF